MLKGDKMVKVAAFGGVTSTTHIHDNCMRVKQWRDSHEHIEKVIILYCGDFDSTGDWLDEYLVNAIEYYTGWKHHEEFEFIRVAVSPEHIEEYDLIEDPEYNPELNGDPRFERFQNKYPDLIEKYGEKFGIQVEAMLTTTERINTFKELLQDAIDEHWDEDIYIENCPDEEYDYEANGDEEPEDVVIDDYPEYPGEGEEDLTI
ncbi:MAG: hypothetical protein WCF23_09570 [Candidatus Nitrosopolaris sp.]